MHIYRKKDLILNNDNIEKLYTFNKFPVFMGCTEDTKDNDKFSDMNWWIGKESGFIQLDPILELDIVYQSSHGSGKIGNTWINHHKSFAKFLKIFEPEAIFEIGGAHGTLASIYKEYKNIPWTILDPNPEVEDKSVDTIRGYFDYEFAKNINFSFDTIVHSHVFEHVYNPTEFVEILSECLKKDQNLIFSIPNLYSMLQNKYTNALNFEHTTFLTEPYIDFLLNKYDFKLIKKTLL